MAVVVAVGAGGCSAAPARCPEPTAAAIAAWVAMSAGDPSSTAVPAVVHDLPQASEWLPVQRTLMVDVSADGKRFVNGSPVEEDAGVIARVREAVLRHPEVRAVIRADASVAHGRVIRVMDLLKQAGVSKMAFGVVAGEPQGGQSSPALVSRARTAVPVGGNVWACPFPPESDAAKIDRAVVVLQVTVDARGNAVSGRVLSDPGYGFGAAAVTCAQKKVYSPALDSAGAPIDGVTPPIRVTYSR